MHASGSSSYVRGVWLVATLATVAALALATVAALTLATLPARASAQATELASPAPPPPPRGPRPVPNYDGLPEAGPSAADVALATPRLLLTPVHLVLEYVVRRPLEEIVTVIEREHWIELIASALTWDGRRAGIAPTAIFDFGLQPSAGLFFFWNDVGAPGHDVRVYAATGGDDFLRAEVRDRVLLDREVELTFRAQAWTRPDQIFQGFGPLSLRSSRSRFRRTQVEGAVELLVRLWRRSRAQVSAGVDSNWFDPNGYQFLGGDPSIATSLENGSLGALPPGFDGYTAYRHRLRLTVDSRPRAPAPGHGLRVEGLVEQGLELSAPRTRHWVRTGVALAGFVEPYTDRVLSLHVRAQFSDPIGPAAVPLTEQVQLGGELLDLPGFLPGTLVDRSALVATLRHRWPLWVQVDATLFFATGNVFGPHLQDFAFDRLRLSWGLGLQTLGDHDESFRVGLAFGTAPFVHGTGVEAVRAYAGGTLGL